MTDRDDGIVVFSLGCQGRIGNDRHEPSPQDYTLVVHRSSLVRSHVPEENEVQEPLAWSQSDLSVRATPRTVPWEEWGPQNTRIIEERRPTRWICWVHGHRLVEVQDFAPPRTYQIPKRSPKTRQSKLALVKRLFGLGTNDSSSPKKTGEGNEEMMDEDEEELDPDTLIAAMDWAHSGSGNSSSTQQDDATPIATPTREPSLVEFLSGLDFAGGFEGGASKIQKRLYLKVWDFNPRAIQRCSTSSSSQEDHKAYPLLPISSNDGLRIDHAAQRGPVIIAGPGRLAIKGQLPFIETVIETDLPSDERRTVGAIMNGESIVLIRVSLYFFTSRRSNMK